MMKRKALIGLFGAFFATASHADNYLVSVGGNFETQIYVDTKRIMTKPTETMAWILTVNYGKDRPSYSRSLEKFNCAQRQSAIVSFVGYGEDGSPVQNWKGDGVMNYVVPDTVGETTLEFVCALPTRRVAMAKKLVPENITQVLKIARHFYDNRSTTLP